MSIQSEIDRLAGIKAALKTAINGSGNTVGDVFADYPPAVSNGRAGIASAITEKGVQTPADAPFDVLEANVRAIETGGGLSELIDLGIAQEVGSGFLKSYKLSANNPPSGWEYCVFYVEKPKRYDGIIFDKTGSLFPPGTESTYGITVESNSVSVEASKGNFEKAPQGYAIFAK